MFAYILALRVLCSPPAHNSKLHQMNRPQQEHLDEKPYTMTIKRACELIPMSRSKLYELMRTGTLKPIKIGSAVRIWRRDIEAYLQSLTDGESSFVRKQK